MSAFLYHNPVRDRGEGRFALSDQLMLSNLMPALHLKLAAALDPWGKIWNQGKNSHLFLASIPVLAAFIVLFMNRADDTLTLDRRLTQKK